ncbi:MAG: KpsF/GutQ family sugar-phosphate isomerase [Candidatus Gastranaerophilales bacterium]|nr:KpsF/GutQ family sugar-phosphate isomerase [Candidatus Gastranaerophilales bacterium]
MTNTIDLSQINISERSILGLAKEVFEIESSSITKLVERLGEPFLKALDLLYRCKGRVIVTGMGKSGLIGKKIAATFSSTGTPSFYLHPAESTHGDSGVITKEDVVLAISYSGETAELLQLLPLIKRFDIKLIALTGRLNSTLSQKSDMTLDISVEKEACPLGLAPTASTTVTLAMGDALALCLLKKRGFTPEDFLVFHPSGSLGKSLLYKVEDLMISGKDMPLVRINDRFQEAIVEISDKKIGITIVVNNEGKTQGILTDGDIRRTIMKYKDISTLTVKDVMTVNPKIIEKDALAAKALQIMEKFSITSIIINNENGAPEGIVHIHDLLKAGVA